jgi:GxxExxY protein
MHEDHTALDRICIGCGFGVMNTLGCGSLEKVYENALAQELRTADLSVAQPACNHGQSRRYRRREVLH